VLGILGEYIRYLTDEAADGRGWMVLSAIVAIIVVAGLVAFLIAY
jgi:hypothetical protein